MGSFIYLASLAQSPPKNEGIRAFLHAFFYKRILYNIPLKNACKKAHRSLHKS